MNLPIRYSAGGEVALGDHVSVRLFLFLRRNGRVSYVPGVSALHREMEHDGIRLVGVTFDKGGAGGFWVDPATSVLISTVKFLARDQSPLLGLPSEEIWT